MLQKREERITFKTPPAIQKCFTMPLTVRFSESRDKHRRTTCGGGSADVGPAAKENGGGGREVGR